MWVYYPTDSAGQPTTVRHVITIDGERYVIEPTDSGAVQVPNVVGEYLVRETAVMADQPADSDGAE